MGLIFSGQKTTAGTGTSQQGSITDGDVLSAAASAFHGANNTEVNGGTFNVAGRDNVQTVINNFNVSWKPDGDLTSKIHDWLSPKVDFRSIQLDTFKKRTPGTGKWLLDGEEFQRWLRTKGGILWGTGIPGAGKSVVASIVINYLETLAKDAAHGEISLAYAYSRYTERIAVEEILGGLLDQQLRRYPSLFQLVEPLYREHQDGVTKPTQDELIDLLVKFSKIFKMTFYVVDGIDEARRNVQFNLIAVLRRIGANFFLTSRPLENLESELPEVKAFRVVAHDNDIILLIEALLTENPVLRGLLTDLAFKREVVEEILEKSAGMFLHAALQLAALEDCLSVYDIRSTLEEMPAGLEGMYVITMTRIEQQAAKHVTLAKRILALVVHTEQSLKINELQYALIADLQRHTFDADRIVDERSLLSVCCGLTYVEKESGTVRLIHITAKDVLQPILLKDYPLPHTFVASTCISRLISCDFHKSDTLDILPLDDTFYGRPFLRYAYDNWYIYARHCDPQSPESHPIRQFLEQCQSFPLEFHFTDFPSTMHGSGLHVASALGLLPYLRNIPNPNTPTVDYGFTPLLLSLAHQSPSSESAMHLLGLPGIDVNAADIWLGSTPLMVASRRGLENVVSRLLRFSEIDVNSADRYGKTTLIHAAEMGREGVVAHLLVHPGLEVNASDTDGMTALAHATKYGHEGVVKQLLRHDDINVDIIDDEGRTAAMLAFLKGYDSIGQQLLQCIPLEVQSSPWVKLMYASKRGRVDLIQELLASFDDILINKPDDHGYTALILASFYGHETVVQQLLDHPAIQVNLVSRNGYTALIAASETGRQQIVRHLIHAPGINVNHTVDGTALHYASREGHDAIVQELLRHPWIDVNVLDTRGWTALMHASNNGYTGVVKQLCQYPAIDINARVIGGKHRAGWTALMFACQQPIVELLLQNPAIDVNSIADNGWTALMQAADWGSTAVMQRLLQHPGIDANAADNEGRTALLLEIAAYHPDVVCAVRLLLEFPGIDVNATDNDGRTPLIWASSGNMDTFKLLLEFPGINVNATDNHGWTPLMWAAYSQKLDNVKLLLAFPGIDVDVVDKNGDTALSLVGKAEYADSSLSLAIIEKAEYFDPANTQAIRDALSRHVHQPTSATSSPDTRHIS